MSDLTIKDILANCQAIAAQREEAARQGVMIRREHAAQLAETAWGQLTSSGTERSSEWLDGCQAGVEMAAEIIRQGQVRIVA